MINRALFFDRIRQSLYRGKMTEKQVSGVTAVLAAWDGAPTRYAAYGLATAFAEVGANMQPVREGFKATDAAARAYVKQRYWTMKDGSAGYGRPAGPHGHVYYGRGYVQLTWLRNYERASKVLGVDCVRDPDLALEPDYAARIMRDGMERGWFTGKKLADYISGERTDYKGARRIINGQDRAGEIAGYALAFEAALRAAGYGKAAAKPVVEEDMRVAPDLEPVLRQPDDPGPDADTSEAVERPWWERSPVIRQIVNTLGALGITGSAALGLDKDIIITLAIVVGVVSVVALIIQARK